MMTATYEFADKEVAKRAFDSLTKKGIVTGELELKQWENGKWLIKVHAEKDIKDATVEKLGGHKLE